MLERAVQSPASCRDPTTATVTTAGYSGTIDGPTAIAVQAVVSGTLTGVLSWVSDTKLRATSSDVTLSFTTAASDPAGQTLVQAGGGAITIQLPLDPEGWVVNNKQ